MFIFTAVVPKQFFCFLQIAVFDKVPLTGQMCEFKGQIGKVYLETAKGSGVQKFFIRISNLIERLYEPILKKISNENIEDLYFDVA